MDIYHDYNKKFKGVNRSLHNDEKNWFIYAYPGGFVTGVRF